MKSGMLSCHQSGMLVLLWLIMPVVFAETQVAVLELNKPVKSAAPVVKVVKKPEWCTRMSKTRLEQRAMPYQTAITHYAQRYRVDAALVQAVIAIESCYNPTAVSPKGAQGLMQLIPATAERFGISNSMNARQNIRGGTRYLAWLIKRFDGDVQKALAGYNAGEGAVDKYKGIPPYKETQHYVRNVLAVYKRLALQSVAAKADGQNDSSAKPRAGAVQQQSGRVVKQYTSPLAKAKPAKPGRAGWQVNKARAPHLYKQ